MSIMILVVFILAFIACTSTLLILPMVAGRRQQIEPGATTQELAQLRDAFEELTARVALLEEGMDFYSQLGSSDDKPRIEPGPEA